MLITDDSKRYGEVDSYRPVNKVEQKNPEWRNCNIMDDGIARKHRAKTHSTLFLYGSLYYDELSEISHIRHGMWIALQEKYNYE